MSLYVSSIHLKTIYKIVIIYFENTVKHMFKETLVCEFKENPLVCLQLNDPVPQVHLN